MQANVLISKIFLVGYMGVGKTTLGKELAQYFHVDFIDLDAVIESRTGMSVSDFFRKKGEESFRLLEHDCLQEISRGSHAVVSTGGGTPCFFDNMECMLSNGIVVHLHTEESWLVDRLFEKREKRPLLHNKSKEEILDFIRKGIAERKPFYNKAHIIYAPEGLIQRSDIDIHATHVAKLIYKHIDSHKHLYTK